MDQGREIVEIREYDGLWCVALPSREREYDLEEYENLFHSMGISLKELEIIFE